MKRRVTLDAVYAISGDVVVREVGGETIIIPLASGINDTENELHTLDPIGQTVWQRLDGKKRLKEIVAELTVEFKAPAGVIEKDVIGLMEKLLKNGMIVYDKQKT